MEDYSTYAPWIIMAVNGLIAGWLASLLLGGRGGIIRDIFIGMLKLPFLYDWPWLHLIAVSTIGALLIIILGRIVGR
jgi:uncharacterized membrane protein YeaQ/YmgE (transglycosylase-associated protein family)